MKNRNVSLLWTFNYLLIIFCIVKIVLDHKIMYSLLNIDNTVWGGGDEYLN